jgi:elongation factor Ts
MADVTPALVVKLREMTNAGMLECKKALIAANGDLDAAVDVLRKKGMATAAKKALRDAREGVMAQSIQPDSRVGVLVEVNCETDFVARNDGFRAFAEEIARALVADPKADLEATRTAQVSKMGENIRIPRFERFEVSGSGIVAAYIHTGAKVGVLLEVGCGKDATAASAEFKQLVKDITLQIAAASPVAVTREQVDPALVAKEKEIAAEQVKNKPAQAIEKIVQGKLDKYFQTYCLVDQGFVKQNGEVSVREHIASIAKLLGDEVTVRRFKRFQVGEATA